MTTLEVEGMERHKQENPFNYTEDQLAEKKLALHNMKIIYPDVNPFYAELVYDMCKNTDEAKIELLKQKILNEPFKYKDRYKTLQEELDLVINDTILNPIVVTGHHQPLDQPLEKVEPNERVCDASQVEPNIECETTFAEEDLSGGLCHNNEPLENE